MKKILFPSALVLTLLSNNVFAMDYQYETNKLNLITMGADGVDKGYSSLSYETKTEIKEQTNELLDQKLKMKVPVVVKDEINLYDARLKNTTNQVLNLAIKNSESNTQKKLDELNEKLNSLIEKNNYLESMAKKQELEIKKAKALKIKLAKEAAKKAKLAKMKKKKLEKKPINNCVCPETAENNTNNLNVVNENIQPNTQVQNYEPPMNINKPEPKQERVIEDLGI